MAQEPTDDEMSATDYVDIASYMNPLYHGHARNNVQKWGLQSTGVLLCATMEELGEMAMEMRENMEIDSDNEIDEYSMYALVDDIAELGERAQMLHEDIYEDEDGEPISGPSIEFTGNRGRLQDELTDTIALLYQMQAALDRLNLNNAPNTDVEIEVDPADVDIEMVDQ